MASRCVFARPAGVCTASITDVDDSFFNRVVSAAKGGASVDGVLVVEAAAGGIQLNKLVAHGDE